MADHCGKRLADLLDEAAHREVEQVGHADGHDDLGKRIDQAERGVQRIFQRVIFHILLVDSHVLEYALRLVIAVLFG